MSTIIDPVRSRTSYPRPDGRGPIEACAECLRACDEPLAIRDLTVAAPLKLRNDGVVQVRWLSIRDLTVAAPLKRHHLDRRPASDYTPIRDLTVAAPLKHPS